MWKLVVEHSFFTFARASCFVLMLDFPTKTLEIRSQELFFFSIQAAYSIVGTATEDAEDRLSGTGFSVSRGLLVKDGLDLQIVLRLRSLLMSITITIRNWPPKDNFAESIEIKKHLLIHKNNMF